MIRRHDARQVAGFVGKTENWVRRNARRYPHSKAGRTYFWTDEDVVALLAALQVRPTTTTQAGLKPAPRGRRSA